MIRLFFILLLAASLFLVGPLTAASVNLRWSAPGDDGTSGTASQYDIRYSTSPIDETNWNSAIQVAGEPTPQPAGSQESITISGLKAATVYYFAIKASDERPNWAPLSNISKRSTCPAQCVGSSGNVDGSADGLVDLSDLVLLQNYILGAQAGQSICLDAANCDGSADGHIDLSDFSTMVQYLWGAGVLATCSQ